MKHLCSNHPIPPLPSFYPKKLSTSNSAVPGPLSLRLSKKEWTGHYRKAERHSVCQMDLRSFWFPTCTDFYDYSLHNLGLKLSLRKAFSSLGVKLLKLFLTASLELKLLYAAKWVRLKKKILALENGIYVQHRNWILLGFNCYVYAMFLLFNMYNCSNSGNLISFWIVSIFVFTLNFWLFFSYLVE